MLKFSVLSSGSKANSIYVSDGASELLVDCGLSGKKTAQRLSGIGVDPCDVEAIIVTHEHHDHVSGVPVFAKRHNCAVFANEATIGQSSSLQKLPAAQRIEFETGEKFFIGDICIESFSVTHDAVDPVGLKISSSEVSLAIITDLGQLTHLVRQQTRNIDALILESNHDLELLSSAPYPWELKQRISSRVGHLSNVDAQVLLKELSADQQCRLQFVVAAHISENSNHPDIVIEGFESAWQSENCSPRFIAAGVESATELFEVSV